MADSMKVLDYIHAKSAMRSRKAALDKAVCRCIVTFLLLAVCVSAA